MDNRCMDNRDLYNRLYDAWKKAFPGKKGGLIQAETNGFWKEKKQNPNDVELKISELIARNFKAKTNFFKCVVVAQTKEIQRPSSSVQKVAIHITEEDNMTDIDVQIPATSTMKSSHVQLRIQSEIHEVNALIISLRNIKDSGLATDEQLNHLKINIKKKLELEKKFKSLQDDVDRQRKSRETKKRKYEQFKLNYPDLESELKGIVTTSSAGRPRLEESQSLLVQTIVQLVAPTGSAEARRRKEVLNSCRTLDDLHAELKLSGYNLSRSALYLRLQPRSYKSIHGKRHVKTVPVKLARAQNDARKQHHDSHFAAATIKYVKDLAEIFGEQSVFVISQDDKSRVPLGLPAANIQSPLLMHLECRVLLPDHDWVIAAKHKLIPSVYAGIVFDDKNKLTYSGPTYIAIRSGKHDSSTAESHGIDFRRMMELESFKVVSHVPGARVLKPIIMLVDGGPDENPRFPKVMAEAIKNFKLFNLDAMFIATNAPGHSAFNPVERRMAPLSKDLAGVILPHEHYGSHLDAKGQTINDELEIQNFEKAGRCLAEVWNGNNIDDYDVHAEYIPPPNARRLANMPTEEWKAVHVRQSQYLLQLVKCDNRGCCSELRTNIKAILSTGFIPTPVPFVKSADGVFAMSYVVPEVDKPQFSGLAQRLALNQLAPVVTKFPILPFDLYCPSVQGQLEERICKVCHLYHPSKVSRQHHEAQVHKKKFSNLASIAETIEDVIAECHSENIFVINDMAKWLRSEYIDEF